MEDISFVAGGAAGTGIITIGETLGKLFQRMGWFVFTYDDYQSIIKGGHNAIYTRICDEQIYSQSHQVDILIALDKQSIERHVAELKDNGVVLYNSKFVPEYKHDKKGIGIDFDEMALKAGNAKFSNIVAVGCVLGLFDSTGETLNHLGKVLQERFGKKGQDVVDSNLKAAKMGYDYVREKQISIGTHNITAKEEKNHLFLTGNQAVVLGAVKAGVKLLCQYPMTPASSILDVMVTIEAKKNIVVRQPEDELAAINMAIGAGAAGIRAMTATSGGGFALMTEAMGFAGMAEIPVVVVESQRGGPSTGMPTHTEQADLRFVMHASQGDFPRVVITPGCVSECFYLTFEAFNLAEKLQTPVVVLVDKYLSSSFQTVEYFNTSNLKVERGALLTDEEASSQAGYKRYADVQSGISPRGIPGQKNCLHVDSSYEHDETGWTTEDAAERLVQVHKRARKLGAVPEELVAPVIYGDKKAKVGIVCWGSTKMPALEALKLLQKEKISACIIHFRYVLPFPSQTAKKLLSSYNLLLNVEGNSTAQFAGVVRQYTGIELSNNLLRYDGKPFYPVDIAQAVKNLLKQGLEKPSKTKPRKK